ncbi:MAG: cytidine deaminase [Sphingomonadales bacterium]
MSVDDQQLFERAKAVRQRAYAPYSRFLVGAAILDDQGQVHVGCNVENAAFPQGACAEAGAIAAMVAGGGRKIARIAVVGGPDTLIMTTPCGGCRQRIAEFASADTRILIMDETGAVRAFSIADLLPHGFGPDDLQ